MSKEIKILLTGAGSILGSQILNSSKDKYKIYGINTLNKNKQNFYLSNTSNIKELEIIFNKIRPDIVIHLATYYLKNYNNFNHKKSKSLNLDFGKNLIKLCKKYTVKKFIYTGSAIENKSNLKKKNNFYIKYKIQFTDYLNKISNNKKFLTKIYILYLNETYTNNDKRDRFLPNLLLKVKNKKIKLIDYSTPLNFIKIEKIKSFIFKLINKKNEKKINKMMILSKNNYDIVQIINLIKFFNKKLIIKWYKKKSFDKIELKKNSIKIIKLNDNFLNWLKIYLKKKFRT